MTEKTTNTRVFICTAEQLKKWEARGIERAAEIEPKEWASFGKSIFQNGSGVLELKLKFCKFRLSRNFQKRLGNKENTTKYGSLNSSLIAVSE